MSATATAETPDFDPVPREPIKPGIYFGLSDEDYHADPAIGSTGFKRLLSSPPDFWWQSPMNPAHDPTETETPAKTFGKAVHKCVLEGRLAFELMYAPTDHPGNIKAGKEERAIIADRGRIPIKRDDFNRILAASAFIKANPHLASAFENGQPEVSVFWEVGGVMFKARFDYLKPVAIVDLKSIRNPLDKEFRKALTDAIANYDYALSAEHYCEGRRQMARLVEVGAVYGDHDPVWLKEVAAVEAFAFVLVFWQADGSPISHGFKLSPNNPMFSYARKQIEQALTLYRKFISEFGPDTAWMLNEPIEELDETDMPIWWQVRMNQG